MGIAQAEHRCPDPLPHEQSCPVVSPTSVQAVPESAPTMTADWFAEPVVVHFCFPTVCRRIAPTLTHVSTPPLFIAHCVLLI
ncbi:MAG: hypothetical protein C0501_02325 [Isosphaera sp.]|nr:hypothetical protein [Isosphaera sp.]